MGKEESFVVVRADNNHFIMSVNQSEWTHNISNAKIFTKEAALDKVDKIEASDFEFRVYASPFKKEFDEYRKKFG
jgi:hypothetical protein